MIGDRNRQLELINLGLFWALAVSVQILLCNLISSFIWLYVFKADFLSSYRIIEWIVSILRERLFWGFCLGLFWSWCTFLLNGQIELETALYLTGIIGVLLGVLPLMIGRGNPNWTLFVFFMECAPLSALFWQLNHLGYLQYFKWQAKRADEAIEVKAGKTQDSPKAQVSEQALGKETNDPKQEDKPEVKPTVVTQELPVKPKSLWRID